MDVSTDGGRRFVPADLHGPNRPNARVRWRTRFAPRAAGSYELIARATDWRGRTQPSTVPFNDGGYLFWATVRHPVRVT